MRNDLLGVAMEKSFDVDEGLPSHSDLLELMVVNKIRRGDFDDVAEQVTEVLGRECDFIYEDGDCCLRCGTPRDREDFFREMPSDCCLADSRMFLSAGYSNCMDEAIRFLVEEENISPEHPVVRNLKAHLEQSKQRILEIFSEAESRGGAENLAVFGALKHPPEPALCRSFLPGSMTRWNAA